MPKKKKRIEKKVTIGGKRVSVYGYTAYEIQEKIEALEKQEERKKYPLFTDILEEWEEEHFEDIAIGTKTCYAPAIKRAKEEFKDFRLCDITPLDVSALLEQLADLGYSHQTVKVQRTVIKLVYKYAQKQNIIATNPVDVVELPKKLPKGERQIPSDDEIGIVLNSENKTFGLFALFLLSTGCRRGEALAVKWRDIDFVNKTIVINKKIVYDGNKPILEQHTKTQAGMRTVIIPNVLSEALKKHKGNKDDYLFGNGEKPFTNSQFRQEWDNYLKETGLHITPHQLRHAYATLLYDANVDEKVAQNLMGHSSIDVTKDIYTHIRQGRISDARSGLNDLLSNGFKSEKTA